MTPSRKPCARDGDHCECRDRRLRRRCRVGNRHRHSCQSHRSQVIRLAAGTYHLDDRAGAWTSPGRGRRRSARPALRLGRGQHDHRRFLCQSQRFRRAAGLPDRRPSTGARRSRSERLCRPSRSGRRRRRRRGRRAAAGKPQEHSVPAAAAQAVLRAEALDAENHRSQGAGATAPRREPRSQGAGATSGGRPQGPAGSAAPAPTKKITGNISENGSVVKKAPEAAAVVTLAPLPSPPASQALLRHREPSAHGHPEAGPAVQLPHPDRPLRK